MGFMLEKFKVRDFLNSYDDEDAWQEFEGFDAREAAQEYMDANFPYEDSQGPFEVQVKSPDGSITVWNVEVEFEPTFSPSRMFKLILNGKELWNTGQIYSFEQLTWFAFPRQEDGQEFSIVYSNAAGPDPEGILQKNGSLRVRDGTIVNVTMVPSE